MKKIVSFSLKLTTINKLTTISRALGINRSKLLESEIVRQLTPVMPLVESILKQQQQLKVMLDGSN